MLIKTRNKNSNWKFELFIYFIYICIHLNPLLGVVCENRGKCMVFKYLTMIAFLSLGIFSAADVHIYTKQRSSLNKQIAKKKKVFNIKHE